MNKTDFDLIKANTCTIDNVNTSDYGLYYQNIHLSIWFTPIYYHRHLSKSMGCISISSKKEKEECVIRSKVLYPINMIRKNRYHTIQVKRKEENVYE